MVAPTGFEPVT